MGHSKPKSIIYNSNGRTNLTQYSNHYRGPKVAEQVELMMEAEELRGLLKDRRMKKVLAFLEAKKQELVQDMLEGNYRQEGQTLGDLGAWMLAAEERFRMLNYMLHLENLLPLKDQAL